MIKDKVLWVASLIFLILVSSCFILPLLGLPFTKWEIFLFWEAVLGFIANLAIFIAAYKYMTKETLDIKGIGKVKISRMQNNIQDLTNLIGLRLFNGANYQRTAVLSAFYKDTTMEIVNPEEEYLTISKNSDSAEEDSDQSSADSELTSLSLCRRDLKTVSNLIEAVKWMLFEGNEPDNATLSEIYRQWYRIGGNHSEEENVISVSFYEKEFSVDPSEFKNIEEMIKVAECFLNEGKKLDSATMKVLYSQWYKIH